MKISEIIESMTALKREYGDVEVVMEDHIYGHVPAAVNVTLERGTYEALIEPEI